MSRTSRDVHPDTDPAGSLATFVSAHATAVLEHLERVQRVDIQRTDELALELLLTVETVHELRAALLRRLRPCSALSSPLAPVRMASRDGMSLPANPSLTVRLNRAHQGWPVLCDGRIRRAPSSRCRS